MKTTSKIIRERIKELTKEYKNGNEAMMMLKVFNQSKILVELLPLIEEYENNSVERLLEEMPEGIELDNHILNSDGEWRVSYFGGGNFDETIHPIYGFGATPQEALQKLKSKLNNQE